jgi:hypothetical protein
MEEDKLAAERAWRTDHAKIHFFAIKSRSIDFFSFLFIQSFDPSTGMAGTGTERKGDRRGYRMNSEPEFLNFKFKKPQARIDSQE